MRFFCEMFFLLKICLYICCVEMVQQSLKIKIMRNLLERLKPELLEALEREKLLYPCTMRCLEDELKRKVICSYLSVSDAYIVVGLTGSLTFTISELVNCFDEL